MCKDENRILHNSRLCTLNRQHLDSKHIKPCYQSGAFHLFSAPPRTNLSSKPLSSTSHLPKERSHQRPNDSCIILTFMDPISFQSLPDFWSSPENALATLTVMIPYTNTRLRSTSPNPIQGQKPRPIRIPLTSPIFQIIDVRCNRSRDAHSPNAPESRRPEFLPMC
jgi:hypothetical protein